MNSEKQIEFPNHSETLAADRRGKPKTPEEVEKNFHPFPVH
jgi:hypothetical protein